MKFPWKIPSSFRRTLCTLNSNFCTFYTMNRIAQNCKFRQDGDSYMYGKLLGFLRVSSLDPEFLIQCPDPVNEFSGRFPVDTDGRMCRTPTSGRHRTHTPDPVWQNRSRNHPLSRWPRILHVSEFLMKSLANPVLGNFSAQPVRT